jgi:hypothetical protein
VKLYCSANEAHNTSKEIYRTREFNRAPDETSCPQPGCPGRLETGMERNARRKTSQRGGRLRDESDAEAKARAEFSRLVCEWPCWARKHRPCERCEGLGFDGGTGEVCSVCNGDKEHHCRGRKNAHHLIPVDWMRDTFSELDEADFLAIAYAPILGAPACQHNFHAALESRADVIHWHELDPELFDFCKRIEAKYPDRPSMLERLKLESPIHQGVRS